MIKVNGAQQEWQRDMTIKSLLEICDYQYSELIVTLNHKQIFRADYANTKVKDGDRISILHPIVGG